MQRMQRHFAIPSSSIAGSDVAGRRADWVEEWLGTPSTVEEEAPGTTEPAPMPGQWPTSEKEVEPTPALQKAPVKAETPPPVLMPSNPPRQRPLEDRGYLGRSRNISKSQVCRRAILSHDIRFTEKEDHVVLQQPVDDATLARLKDLSRRLAPKDQWWTPSDFTDDASNNELGKRANFSGGGRSPWCRPQNRIGRAPPNVVGWWDDIHGRSQTAACQADSKADR